LRSGHPHAFSDAIESFVSNLRKAQQKGTVITSWVDAFLAPLKALEPEIAKVDLAIHALCTNQIDAVIERLASVPRVSFLQRGTILLDRARIALRRLGSNM
jgi:hypothetical protein